MCRSHESHNIYLSSMRSETLSCAANRINYKIHKKRQRGYTMNKERTTGKGVSSEKFRWCFSAKVSGLLDEPCSPDVEAPGTLVRQHVRRRNLRAPTEYRPVAYRGGRFNLKGTTGLMWLRSCVSPPQHGHDLAASSSSTDVRRSYLCAVFALVLVQGTVG